MMLQVKDQSGNVVPGLLKNDLGAIIVKRDKEYNHYIQSKQQAEIINNLTKEVSELKELIEKILSNATINKNSTEGQ